MPDIRPKLLIIEDDPGLQRQLRWAYDGYQLFIAGDREEALELLRAEEPPVVTLDLGLPPDPDGIREGMAVLAAILSERPATKVIVASGHGDAGERPWRHRGRRMGLLPEADRHRVARAHRCAAPFMSMRWRWRTAASRRRCRRTARCSDG